ncbi:MAG: DEAD/DEAH box helicase, partial [Pseudomonadaceae bacterium]
KVLAKLPAKRQNLLFSATFSKDITDLAGKLLHDPERIEVTPPNTTVERIEQRVFHIASSHKRALLAHLITQGAWEQVLVFTRTKHGANRLAEYLEKHGLPAAAIHGNKSQNARTKALADFKANQVRILVATDIAARGLDIDQLPHVVNFELPNVEEDYVHRIGRTGRAGRSGEAISLVAPDEEKLLKGIERLTKQRIPDGDLMGFDASTIEAEKPEVREPRPPRPQRGERKARGERDKPADKGAEQKERNRRSQSKARKPARDGAASEAQAPARPPQLPPNRAPDEFLDDEVDNFGNRVDYVSPYQNKQNRGRRPGAPAQPGSAPRAAGAARSGAPGAPSGKGKRQGAGQGQTARSGQPRNGQQRRKNEGRRIEEPAVVRQEAAKPREKQPVIIHKESKIDRLPSLDQLEQLPTRPRGEKPALLTRNREA